MTAGAQTRERPPVDRAERPARHIPGLDGLRALAILAVLVFHLNPGWLPGGFLGVDIFFVVSGFLITALLVRELSDRGRLDLRGFWTRRARRLLPALLVCVPVSILAARLVQGDLLVHVARQALGALTFSTNWVEIHAGSSYFDQTSPQLFMNFWSLAVEEQFYLLWPLSLAVLLTVVPSPRARAQAALGLGVGSALLMGVLYSADHLTRVYYGTDTHLMGLMLGAALAFAWSAPAGTWPELARVLPHRGPVVLGALALLTLLLLTLSDDTALTFRGGILVASVATAVLVADNLDGAGVLRHVLDRGALRWVGARSYGIYLWHWPVILVLGQASPRAPGTSGFLLVQGASVAFTLAVAAASYRFVETPVRRLGFAGCGRRVGHAVLSTPRRARRVIAGTAAVAVITTLLVVVTAPDKTSTQRLLEANTEIAGGGPPSGSAGAAGQQDARRAVRTTGKPRSAAATFAMPSGKEVDGFGDSMMVASVPAMRYYFPGIRMDARSNRKWAEGRRVVEAADGSVRRAVVLVLGTNAGVNEQTMRAVLDDLGTERMVVVVNLYGRFSRISGDNATLRDVVKSYPNAIVADWDAAVTAHPDQLQPDGIHPSLTGAHLFAKTIRAAFASLSERHTGKKVHLEELPIP